MPSLRLSDAVITDLPPTPSGKTFYWDTETIGFGVSVSPKSKTFVVQADLGGKSVRVALGRFPNLDASMARSQAMGALALMARGIDPRKPSAANPELASTPAPEPVSDLPSAPERASVPIYCVVATVLNGRRFSPGERVPSEIWDVVPLKNKTALLQIGSFTTELQITASEGKLHEAARTARAELQAIQEVLAEIGCDKEKVTQEITRLEAEHRAKALHRYRRGGTSDTTELDAARAKRDELASAEEQAVDEAERLTDRAARLERIAELQRAADLVERRKALCKEIEAGVKALAPKFDQYHTDAEVFARLSRSTSGQIRSRWRLQNLLNERLLRIAVPSGHRIDDLADLEAKIFMSQIALAVKEEGNLVDPAMTLPALREAIADGLLMRLYEESEK